MNTPLALAMLSTVLVAGGWQQTSDRLLNKQEARQIALSVLSKLPASKSKERQKVDAIADGDRNYIVSYRDYDVWLDKRTGDVHIITDNTVNRQRDGDWPKSALSSSRVAQLAQMYMNAAGFSGPIRIVGCAKNTSQGLSYAVSATPTYKGIPYAYLHTSDMYIEADTGKLGVGYFRDVPEPPLKMNVRINADQAQAELLQYVFANKVSLTTGQRLKMLEQMGETELSIWQPVTSGNNPDKWFGDDVLQEAKEGRGHLVYTVYYQDADHPETQGYFGFVDAATGRLLELQTISYFVGGAPAAPKKAKVRAWNTWQGSMTVIAGKKTYKVANAGIAGAGDSQPATKTIPVLIAKSNLVAVLKYDPSSGLLYREGDRKSSCGKPNKALAQLLAKLR